MIQNDNTPHLFRLDDDHKKMCQIYQAEELSIFSLWEALIEDYDYQNESFNNLRRLICKTGCMILPVRVYKDSYIDQDLTSKNLGSYDDDWMRLYLSDWLDYVKLQSFGTHHLAYDLFEDAYFMICPNGIPNHYQMDAEETIDFALDHYTQDYAKAVARAKASLVEKSESGS